jgi:hypothetical protein
MKLQEVGERCIIGSLIRTNKSRTMKWAGHVARMGRRGMHIGYWWRVRRKENTRKFKT